MGTRTTDCRKFSPNIFNKSKCSHCFRQREEHSAAALECNRASRKVSKCGYLFVAPDWDFNNPLYRTKRWQRRWFVLYDDGELTYSVDEHPETVPQASIDMTKVIEVTTAEDVTGHTNSVAITAPDRVTFIKGTCPEESKWWLNILAAFPKSKGRHKRNATFPGGQATTILQQSNGTITAGGCVVVGTRNRHNSYHKDTTSLTGNTVGGGVDSWDPANNTNVNDMDDDVEDDDDDEGINDPDDDGSGNRHQQDENNKNAGNEITNRVYTDQPVSSKSPPTRDKIHPETKAQVRIRNRNRTAPSSIQVQQDDSESVPPCLLIEDARRDEKLKDIANTITNLSQTSNRWSTSGVGNTINVTVTAVNNALNSQTQGLNDEKPTRDETDFAHYRPAHTTVVNLRPKSLPLASNSTPAIVSAIVKKIPPVLEQQQQVTTGGGGNKSSPRLQQQLRLLQQQQQKQSQSHERGDPDGGCNLDDLSTNYLAKTSELRVNLPAEEILNSKKGWLMKQDGRTGDWTKHWFTLSGAALFYYRDPVSEERGVLDGVLDVNSLTSVTEVNASRNYAFQLSTWDKRRLVLSSLSANSRNSWMTVLKNAAGLQSEPKVENECILATELIIKDNTSDDIKSEIEKDFIKAQRNQELILNNNNLGTKIAPDTSPVIVQKAVTTPVTPLTPKNTMFSSDEEYRTASEGGRRDSVDWGSPLSPSPPIPIALLRAKERMRSRPGNCPRLHKRSRSSPPSSRRSTVDSVGSDELPVIHSVQEELNIDKELQFRLGAAEKERDVLRNEAQEREARMSELLTTLERTEQELNARIREMEEARDNLSSQLDEAKRNAEKIVDRLTIEVGESHKKIKNLEDRLSRGIEENETLYKKLRELESCSPSSFSNLNRHKLKRMDSLSDLTQISDIDPYCLDRDMLADEYNELRSRFEKAVSEIKAMKRELKESQNQFDTLEISYASLKQDLDRQQIEDRSQLQMMAERIQDLTLKYSGSERQVRTLKQKLAKSERRRSLSLKGKEQLTVSKELEIKVTELESKIDDLEKKSPSQVQVKTPSTSSVKKSARRRSLESSASTDSLQFMIRVNDLEKRFECFTSSQPSSAPTIDVKRSSSSPKMSEHLIERLKCLEGVLICSKDRLEQSLHQLQALRSTSRTRRSVSPITDRKDSYRFVERCLVEVVKLIRESCETCVVSEDLTAPGLILLPESNPIKIALMQLEAQLRGKLGDLLKQRRVLRERNELTARKDLELLAERIAFESVCFGKLRESINRAENPELFGQRQTRAEIAETSQLMSMLKAKLGGKCAFKPSGSLDVLAGVLARRLILSSFRKDKTKVPEMDPVEPKILEELLRQQNEINLIAKRYKNNAMENLASGLAAETLSYISSNDLVQGAVQEAWRQAQETVNAELVQSEIAHIMIRNAERFETSITPSFGYTLTAEERITFESFADAVHESLRKEMDNAIEQLSQCYDEALQKMKRGQWRMHLEQERKASEGRQLLSEFADIVAHKALVDARIAVLRGDYTSSAESSSSQLATMDPGNTFSVSSLQKYENLFEELSNDLQISNPDDILAEADFEFVYKNRTIDFISDRAVLKDIANFLSQLEQSISILKRAIHPNAFIEPKAIELNTLADVCQKCCDLRVQTDGLLDDVQHLTASCSSCSELQDTICDLHVQHESQIMRLQQDHAKNMSMLMQQVDSQRHTLESLERERNSLVDEIHQQSNLVEDHERELAKLTMKLKSKEEECHRKENDNLDLMDRLEDQNEKLRNYQGDRDSLESKCSRQDEEYAVLLQERDFIQAELNKERERCRRMERRLEMLEVEHGKQLECLQEAYRDQILSHCSDFTNIADEESFRQRYQQEIEQLRTLCEKGLTAMESSHRRIINDLEDKHRQEIDRLLMEKETALAEETQATLAALDAMRKAHQSEVQREVARFKQEFLRQFQKGEHSIDNTKINEEELEELRQEILSFSEKYSIKCVENAALEEKLRSANQKLKHFQQMQQIELRNKQFRAHLASEDPLSDVNFVQGLTSSKDEMPCPDSEHALENSYTTQQQAHPENTTKSTQEQSLLPISRKSDLHANLRNLSNKSSPSSSPSISLTGGTIDFEDDINCCYDPCYKLSGAFEYNPRNSIEGLKKSSSSPMFSNNNSNNIQKSKSCIKIDLQLNNNRSSPSSHQKSFTTTSVPLTLQSGDNNKQQQQLPITKALTHHQQHYLPHQTTTTTTTTTTNTISPIKPMMITMKTTTKPTTTTTTKPVEQPKNINLLKNLNPNSTQLKLVNNNNNNLRLSCNNRINNSNNSNIIDDCTSSSNSSSNINNNNTSNTNNTRIFSRSNHRNGGSSSSNGGVQNKVAISLGSFSDIIRKTTPSSDAVSSENNPATALVMDRSRGDDHSSSSSSSNTDDENDRVARSVCSKGVFNNNNNELVAAGSVATPTTTNSNINKKKHSTSNFSGKLCSPPPLSGKDIEHHHATSHLRRFELEI
ncbi:protein outspread isoform X2 [Episyrphus balteatus]|uniref:protein outspread isoform X2 n=1 Tax=Episyrphus balteatus TaxID=286459 RepID=UPI0024863AEB|nr:protein outspread isoform X2 [Episyrphus balteatus]